MRASLSFKHGRYSGLNIRSGIKMFENLTDKLGNVFKGLTKRGALSEGDVDTALKEVRSALLEADVALSVVKEFIDKVRIRAVGE